MVYIYYVYDDETLLSSRLWFCIRWPLALENRGPMSFSLNGTRFDRFQIAKTRQKGKIKSSTKHDMIVTKPHFALFCFLLDDAYFFYHKVQQGTKQDETLTR